MKQKPNDYKQAGRAAIERATRRREDYESRLSEVEEDRSWQEARGVAIGLLPQRQVYDGFSVPAVLVAPGNLFDAAKMVMSLKEQLALAKVIGYSYAIVQAGKLVTAGGEGWARAPWEVEPADADQAPLEQASIPMTETKRMTIASISKPITAVAMMHLIENSTLEVSSPFYPLISASFPSAHETVSSITIGQLLSHTSGLNFNCLLDADDPDFACFGCGDLDDVLKQGADGVYYQYKNSNFCLLRQVIEHVTGENYEAYVQGNVFEPMTITGASCTPDEDNPTLYYGASFQPPGHLWGSYEGSCSAYGWHASAIDLAKFLAYVRYNKVLEKSTTDTMLTDELGWKKYSGKRGTYYGHGGDWIDGRPKTQPDLGSFSIGPLPKRGFTGQIMHFPDLVDAVLLVNTRGDFNKSTVLIKAYEAAFQRSRPV